MLANTFAPQDGLLRLYLIPHDAETKKSDAFLLEYNGTYILIDGGHTGRDDALCCLLARRRALLAAHPDLVDDPACRLRLSIMVSHCHGDHVGALYSRVLPSPYLEVETLYLAPDSGLDERFGPSGDSKCRPPLLAAMAEYQPQAVIAAHDFGAENRFSFRMIPDDPASPLITVCPPTVNWGEEARVAQMIDTYCHEDSDHHNVPTLVLNNNSDWFHVRYGERTFLFTGDTVKKREGRDDEALDEMLRAYGDLTEGVDVLKYIHHGFRRDAAAAAMLSLSPRYLVLTTAIATAHEAIRVQFPDSEVKLLNCAEQAFVFTTDGRTLTVDPEV